MCIVKVIYTATQFFCRGAQDDGEVEHALYTPLKVLAHCQGHLHCYPILCRGAQDDGKVEHALYVPLKVHAHCHGHLHRYPVLLRGIEDDGAGEHAVMYDFVSTCTL